VLKNIEAKYYGSFGHFYLTDCTPDNIYYSIFIKSDYGNLFHAFFGRLANGWVNRKNAGKLFFWRLN